MTPSTISVPAPPPVMHTTRAFQPTSSKAAAGAALLRSAVPGLAAGTFASAVTLAAVLRRAKAQPTAARHRAGAITRCKAVMEDQEPVTLAEAQPRADAATINAKQYDFSKLESYSVAELEELYVDSKWCYYQEGAKILQDADFDKLKMTLKKLGSRFSTLNRSEVAFVQASIAFHQGKPIVSDEEYEKLKAMINNSGRRKDVTAFLLYSRGAQYLSKQQLGKMKEAFVLATQVDFGKLGEYSLAELEELYIDALWCYYREGKPLLKDKDYDNLKQQLYRNDSRFPTLKASEVAFVEASIAYYRGEPVVSDDEYESLKTEVNKLGRRKEVTAFLLYERGEQFLDANQFSTMKDEYEKLGLTAVNIEQCSVAQLEEMYVDALWAYYKDGVQLLSDDQYDKLREELQWQGSGFPTLTSDEVDFVKVSLAYWRGEPVATDAEWKELQRKVLADGKRKDVTAFLLYSKGQEVLSPETFEEMKEEMAKLGVTVQKAGTKALQSTLSITSDKLENNIGQVVAMVSALAALPTILCVVLVWAVGLFLDFEFVPSPDWSSLLTAEALPLFGGGLFFGIALTWRLFVFLDLQNPEILCGSCPSCGSQVKTFTGGENPLVEVEYRCKDCGCKMVLNTRERKIKSAGLGAKITGEDGDSFDWSAAWKNMKKNMPK
eukprot:CAMPEP_0197935030 /NCGR_PEP_ID=MMETSP1439-20131203/112685_1 /TAXON_ID=66791 /ORGANISM="Gonyaulax spinifera, Strain CCMP409" /LENGTH=663 /DNA_ID=CAMNT_0043557951 /DNA_START=93 /DNA_END=2084 /DNA_ORIENTATION=-